VCPTNTSTGPSASPGFEVAERAKLLRMTIEYVHASKYGNGAKVAEEFRRLMAAKGVTVDVHHVREAKPKEMPPVDLYVFSSPGRLRFLKRLRLPAGAKYALLVTEGAPRPDKNGRMPTAEEMARWQRVIPIMTGILEAKGLVKIGEGRIQVMDIRGPL
jgi:hypothetical protein